MSKPRIYRYKSYIPRQEIYDHVHQATRDLPDPIFLSIAYQAAITGLGTHKPFTGYQGVTFHYPTNHPRSYYHVLQHIITNPNLTRRQIYAYFQAPISITIFHLEDANLIHNHKFLATEDGITFAKLAAIQLTNRKPSKLPIQATKN